jgi:hypothetical protein
MDRRLAFWEIGALLALLGWSAAGAGRAGDARAAGPAAVQRAFIGIVIDTATATETATATSTATAVPSLTGTATADPITPTDTASATNIPPSATPTATGMPSTASPTPVGNPCGGAWAIVTSPNPGVNKEANIFYGVAVVGSADVWAVGGHDRQALIAHWDGTAWADMLVPALADSVLNAVAVRTAHEVWAVGSVLNTGSGQTETLIERWDGTAWTVVPSPSVSGRDTILTGVAAGRAADVWAVGYSQLAGGAARSTVTLHWNGTTWLRIPSVDAAGLPSVLRSVTVISAADVWAVGSAGDASTASLITLTEHWNGTAWTLVASPNTPNQYTGLHSVAAAGPADVWAVGGGGGVQVLEHWTGSAWTMTTPPPAPPGNL